MCLDPIYLYKRDVATGHFREQVVPCGKCPECLKKKQSAVVVRVLEECKSKGSCWFFTLTYSDDRLPKSVDGTPSLRREDVKNWKKDFRKEIDCSDISWCLIGEYGPRTHRPHYHGLIFGISERDKSIIEKLWSDKYGFTVFKQIPLVSNSDDVGRVARYVAKYVCKDDDFKVFSSTVECPRFMASVGFGYPKDSRFFDWVLCKDKFSVDPYSCRGLTLERLNAIIDRMYYNYRGFHYSLPLYYLRKYFYEKNFKGNLQKCKLLRLVSTVARYRNNVADKQEFEQFALSNSQRPIYEICSLFEAHKALVRNQERISKAKDYLSTYQKSVM